MVVAKYILVTELESLKHFVLLLLLLLFQIWNVLLEKSLLEPLISFLHLLQFSLRIFILVFPVICVDGPCVVVCLQTSVVGRRIDSLQFVHRFDAIVDWILFCFYASHLLLLSWDRLQPLLITVFFECSHISINQLLPLIFLSRNRYLLLLDDGSHPGMERVHLSVIGQFGLRLGVDWRVEFQSGIDLGIPLVSVIGWFYVLILLLQNRQ